MIVCQNLVPLVNIKIAGKWMFIPLKMVLIGIDPYPYQIPLWFAVELLVFHHAGAPNIRQPFGINIRQGKHKGLVIVYFEGLIFFSNL